MGEENKKPDAPPEPQPGLLQKKILYVIIACAIVILAFVLVAKFGFNLDLLSPASGEMSLVQRPATLVHPNITISGQQPHLGITVTTPAFQRVTTGIVRLPSTGIACNSDSECDTGNCVDGVCCDHKCEGNCHYCALPGHVGTCMDVPDWQDPRRACPMAAGGSPECGAKCYSGQCTFPDIGTGCGVCATCDGNGRCTVMPFDDSKCGVVDCSGLDTVCRSYEDLVSNRCVALGTCKANNDPATCTQWKDLPCSHN